MKKKLFTIAMLTLNSLTSCGTLGNKNTYSHNQTTVSPSIEHNTVTESETYPSPSQTDTSVSSVMQAFKSILLNEKKLNFTNKVPYYVKGTLKEVNSYLKDLQCIEEREYTEFSIIDLDGDGVSEIVLTIENDMGYIILRYRDGEVYGNYIAYRCFELLKKNGLFMTTSGADANRIGKLFFLGDTFFYQEKIEENWGEYFLLDAPISKETWDKQYTMFNNLEDAEWYDYSEDAITKKMIDDPAAKESTIPSSEVCYERQKYLDSLAYLIDLSSTSSEDDGKSFYTACSTEMKKIYQLCLEKLTGDEKVSFENKQSEWQEHLNKVLANDEGGIQYNKCAGMLFRRTLYLINIYYGYSFYN